ncbi:MAG: N-6 DNA methylase [Deltaproteobacteria bacterium]|nr:N-6 DNA methylase [Deltaproteobacteria bacterium]
MKTTRVFDLFVTAEMAKPKKLIYKKELLPINNLKVIFGEIRDYFAGNVTGITRDEKIAQNIMRLLCCKIYDEKSKQPEELVEFANRPNEDKNTFLKRIKKLFEKVKSKYGDIFQQDEDIEISANDLSFIVKTMENYYLLGADRDIIADAFEELIGRSFRGGEGQFFTPRNIVNMMINIMQPKAGEKILDPACGSGGFLAHILRHLLLTDKNHHYIAGIDKDLFLSKLAKIYLTILGESECHIFCENSLERPEKWNKQTSDLIQLGAFDLILTNPPFGAKIPVIGTTLLSQYELGHYWNNKNQSWTTTDKLRNKQPPQILFIERIIQFLKEGGRAGIVLPEGIFGNPSDRYIWEYIKKYASIIGIVSLSQETFQPSTHTKTSVVFLEKIKQNRKNIFFAIAKSVGHNKNGKATYEMNSSGQYLCDKIGNKILDDETFDIANSFNLYLNGKLKEENHLGFIVSIDEIKENIYIPESYNPEIKDKISKIKKADKYTLTAFGDLVKNETLHIKRGNEIGSQYYGTGEIPFIRTTDIVNWEIKMDTVKSVSEAIYKKYKPQQDIKQNDILFVNDGTFLIGRSGMVTNLDIKSIIQSHIRKIRVIKNETINPYYLFYLLNFRFVQQQIEVKTFVQATLSTLGNRIMEIYLPIHKDKSEIEKISKEIKKIIATKAGLRKKSIELLKKSI